MKNLTLKPLLDSLSEDLKIVRPTPLVPIFNVDNYGDVLTQRLGSIFIVTNPKRLL